MKKVVYLMEYPLDLPGGGQMSTWTLCDALAGGEPSSSKQAGETEEFTPVVICPKLLKRTEDSYSFAVLTYSSLENREDRRLPRLYNFLKRTVQFARLIRKAKPDIIHVSMSESLLTYGLIRFLPPFKRIPFIYTDRGLCYGYRKHTKLLMRRILKHASAMVCTTAYNKGLWEKEALSVPLYVIPNTISPVFSVYEPEKHMLMRERYGLKQTDFVIGFAGRISEEKDWDFVPVLVRALKDAGLSFRVALVIAAYETKDAQIIKDLKGQITAAVGEEGLLYLQDLSQTEMADYYYLPDVFIMSSVFESFGKAAVEAMSRHCSVVSTAVGGLPEVIGKPENLYTKDTLDRFTARIRQLAEDREELERDRAFFYRRYLENYTLKEHVNRHRKLYETVLRTNL
ncbi:MAG: glycosyltransferase family 4 protein [Lachnospiraceae bacterium]|nr:glycosyltransferase family 4 protein [Lachnospiraceae bacterium]